MTIERSYMDAYYGASTSQFPEYTPISFPQVQIALWKAISKSLFGKSNGFGGQEIMMVWLVVVGSIHI